VHGSATVFGCDICDIPEMEGNCDRLLFCKRFRSAYLCNFRLVELTGNEDSNCLECSEFFWIFCMRNSSRSQMSRSVADLDRSPYFEDFIGYFHSDKQPT
jgi:hypothetical protein